MRKNIGPSLKQARDVLAKVRSEIIEKGYFEPRKLIRITFDQMAKEYMDWAKVHVRSWARYEESRKALLPDFKGKAMGEITIQMIEQWRVRRLASVKPSTCNRDLTFFKAMCTKAIEWEKITESPVKKVKKLKERNEKYVYFSEDEESRLLDACADHLRPIVLMALSTGMRIVDEILALKWDDIDRKNGHVHVRDSKNGRPRTIPMNDGVKEALTDAVSLTHIEKQSPFIFCHTDGKPYGSIKTGFRSALRRAGLMGKGYTPHTCRHSFASKLANKGVSLYHIGSLLGHRDSRMTMRYAHLSPDARREAMEKLNSRATQVPPDRVEARRYNQ